MAQKDGEFRRKQSLFRSTIPSEAHPPQAGRYSLYFSYGCPWAHRAKLVIALKGLEHMIEEIELDEFSQEQGWSFSGSKNDPNTGLKTLREIYVRVEPDALARGIASVPVLYDKVTGTIVNNESGEIIRMLYTAFDALLPPAYREDAKGNHSLLPGQLKVQIEEFNAWVFETVNNGTYRVGFATTDEAYCTNLEKLYNSYSRLESHLSDATHQPFLFGEHVTEADIRLFPTIIRYDPGYSRWMTRNGESPKLIRKDFPHLHLWLRRLYWDETPETRGAFWRSTNFDTMARLMENVPGMKGKPDGASPAILPLDVKERYYM